MIEKKEVTVVSNPIGPVRPVAVNPARTQSANPTSKSVARQSTGSLPNIDLIFLLGILRKGWYWIIPLGLMIGGLASGAVLAMFEPSFEAKYRLEVDLSNYVVFKDEQRYSGEFVELQKAIILGERVIEKVLADPAIGGTGRFASAKDPIASIRSGIKVNSSAGNRIIDVKFVDKDPAVAARVVNSVVDEYLRTRRTIEQIKTSSLERNVMAALQKAEAEVESAKQRVRDLSMQSIKSENVVGEKESGRIDTAYLDELRMKRMELVSQLAIFEINFAEAKSAYEKENQATIEETAKKQEKVVSNEMLESDVVVIAAKNQLTSAQKELEDLQVISNVGPKNPIYIKANRKVENLTAELNRVRELRRKELNNRKELVSPDTAKSRLDSMQVQLKEFKTRKDTIENQIRDYMTSLKQSSASSVDLQFAEADLEEWNEIRSTVHNRRIQLQTEREATDSVRELERAKPPRVPVEEIPWKQLGVAAAGGLGFPFILAVLLELRSRRVDDASHLEAKSQLSVLGEIASIPVRTKRTNKTIANKEIRLFEESVDSLSTTLILRENLRDARVFAITSALSGEGKTSVSCQLAVSISRATGKKVLLVDGDMRSPDVHHVFGRQMTSGLAGYLGGECNWHDALDTEWSDMVHLMSAGHLRGSPHRLLSSGLLESLIQEAKLEYDYIIMDTPPVLPASEALLFAKAADACLVCALRDKSRIEQLIQAYHRLEAAGAKVAGSVLSGVPTREYASYYGEYYTTKV